jgi:hypothetical protein
MTCSPLADDSNLRPIVSGARQELWPLLEPARFSGHFSTSGHAHTTLFLSLAIVLERKPVLRVMVQPLLEEALAPK